MNERIKYLRKTLGLTQVEFGARLGIKGNTVASYELGRSSPIDAVVSLICREFGVSENWLRTGEGEMFPPTTRAEEIQAFLGDVIAEKDSFRFRFLSALAQLDPSDWKGLEHLMDDLIAQRKEKEE